mmetsp:Transcript_105587/g.297396  ORF Transcript_105587/g.297396 Transcript_105587/m.297396 type:complete len:224 (-) Transcript_105587:1538-2209(-)
MKGDVAASLESAATLASVGKAASVATPTNSSWFAATSSAEAQAVGSSGPTATLHEVRGLAEDATGVAAMDSGVGASEGTAGHTESVWMLACSAGFRTPTPTSAAAAGAVESRAERQSCGCSWANLAAWTKPPGACAGPADSSAGPLTALTTVGATLAGELVLLHVGSTGNEAIGSSAERLTAIVSATSTDAAGAPAAPAASAFKTSIVLSLWPSVESETPGPL